MGLCPMFDYDAENLCCFTDLGVTSVYGSWEFGPLLKLYNLSQENNSITLCNRLKKNMKSRQGGELNLLCTEHKGKLMCHDGKEHVLLQVQKKSHIPTLLFYILQNTYLTNLLIKANSRINPCGLNFLQEFTSLQVKYHLSQGNPKWRWWTLSSLIAEWGWCIENWYSTVRDNFFLNMVALGYSLWYLFPPCISEELRS